MMITSPVRLTALPGHVRKPGVAGYFYPSDPDELRQLLDSMMTETVVHGPAPKAIIVPHAGYIYSGATAAHAYCTLRDVRPFIRRVVLLGPAHRVYLQGMALPAASRMATPLGEIRIDADLREIVSRFPQVTELDTAFDQEHSLEVQLPFLQSVLDNFSVLPLVVGDTPPDQVSEVLAEVWGGSETLIVISSDLSHFHDYDTARKLDRETAELIRQHEWRKIGSAQACGCMPMNGLLQLATEKGLHCDIMDLRNSGDTAGDRTRVVGYGSFAFRHEAVLDPIARDELLLIASRSIEHGLQTGTPWSHEAREFSPDLYGKRANFVTLTLDDELRGCIGTTVATVPLYQGVAHSAYNAAFLDPRFPALSAEEFARITITVSVLSTVVPLEFNSNKTLLEQIRPGIHGLTIEKNRRQATFLPSVWESIPSADEFLMRLKIKAGLPVGDVPEQAWIYTSETFTKSNR